MAKIIVKEIDGGEYGIGTDDGFDQFHHKAHDYITALEFAIESQELHFDEYKEYLKIDIQQKRS